MASHIKKFSYAVVSIFGLTLGIFLADGQSTVGSCQNEGQQIVNGQAWDDSEFVSYFREAIALTKSLRSDIQNLKGEIDLLKNRIESHEKSANSSNQELKRQLQQTRRLQCPNGFNYTISNFPKCYTVLSPPTNWTTAQRNCRLLHKDAHLAVINNALEQQIISQMLLDYNCLGTFYYKGKGYKSEHYWVGGQRQNISDCNSTFIWKPDIRTSLPISYNHWHLGEPNCAHGIENGLALGKQGVWNDLACIWPFCSICEVIAHV